MAGEIYSDNPYAQQEAYYNNPYYTHVPVTRQTQSQHPTDYTSWEPPPAWTQPLSPQTPAVNQPQLRNYGGIANPLLSAPFSSPASSPFGSPFINMDPPQFVIPYIFPTAGNLAAPFGNPVQQQQQTTKAPISGAGTNAPPPTAPVATWHEAPRPPGFVGPMPLVYGVVDSSPAPTQNTAVQNLPKNAPSPPPAANPGLIGPLPAHLNGSSALSGKPSPPAAAAGDRVAVQRGVQHHTRAALDHRMTPVQHKPRPQASGHHPATAAPKPVGSHRPAAAPHHDGHQVDRPHELALKGLDDAARTAATGDTEKTAHVLEQHAAGALARLQTLPAHSPDHLLLKSSAENWGAQADAFRALAPRQGYEAASRLIRAAQGAEQSAAELSKGGHREAAQMLRATAQNSRLLAQSVSTAATNTNVTMGRALSEGYRQIVNKSFDNKISAASDNTFFGLRESPAARLRADKGKMQTVFNELDRTMREEGVSLDRAWNSMFDDHRIDGWAGKPRLVPGFPTRSDAAAFLRDHEITKGLLSPMADLARGFTEADDAAVDRARGQLVKSLQDNRQWDIAHQLIADYQKSAKTANGQTEANDLAGREGWDKFTTQAGDFAKDELPLLVLSTAISGGAGAGVKALATAAKWGPRAVRAAQAGAELATFIPTDRLLNDAVNGKRADWSAGALARDAALGGALMLGGSLLAKGVSKGWQLIRAQNFGLPALQQLKGQLIGLSGEEQSLLKSLVDPKGTGRLVTNGEIGTETLARLTHASGNEIALLNNARTGEKMLIRGTGEAIPQLTVDEAKKLAAAGWELEAHSQLRHLNPSAGDGRVLNEGFNQRSSVIVDRRGNLVEFLPEHGQGGLTDALSAGRPLTKAEKQAIEEAKLLARKPEIDQYRASQGLDPYKSNEPTGTVAFADLNGQKVFGTSPEIGRAAGINLNKKALGQQALNDIQTNLGKLKGDRYGQGEAEFLTHAEGEAVIRAAGQLKGQPLGELKVFVDRVTCGKCQDGLPLLAELYNIGKITIRDSHGHIYEVTAKGTSKLQ